MSTAVKVQVDTFPPGQDWGWTTLHRLSPIAVNDANFSGPDDKLESFARYVLANPKFFGLAAVYVNPRFRVTSPDPTLAFLRKASNARIAWQRDTRQILGKAVACKRERALRAMHPLLVQLNFTGLMVSEGKHYFPNNWPPPVDQKIEHEITGQRFGNLIVVEHLSQGRCLCKCDCGEESTVYRKHLMSGATKSCGCRKRAYEEWLRDRRLRRAW